MLLTKCLPPPPTTKQQPPAPATSSLLLQPGPTKTCPSDNDATAARSKPETAPFNAFNADAAPKATFRDTCNS